MSHTRERHEPQQRQLADALVGACDGGDRRIQQLLRIRRDRFSRGSLGAAARLQPVADRNAQRHHECSQCGLGSDQWRADRPLWRGAGRALGRRHRGDRCGADRDRQSLRTDGGGPLPLRRERRGHIHRAARGPRAVVFARRDCARRVPVSQSRPRRLLFGKHLDGVGTFAVRARLAGAPVARHRRHHRRSDRGAGLLLGGPPCPGGRKRAHRRARARGVAGSTEVRHVLLVHSRGARAVRLGVLSVPPNLCVGIFPACEGTHQAGGGHRQQLGVLRCDFRHAAVWFARRPAGPSCPDAGLRYLAPAADLRRAGAHRSQSLGNHGDDGHQLVAGAGGHLAGHDAHRRTAPVGHRPRAHYTDSGARHSRFESRCGLARRPGRRRRGAPGRLLGHAVVLLPAQSHRTDLGGAAVAARNGTPWATASKNRAAAPRNPPELTDPAPESGRSSAPAPADSGSSPVPDRNSAASAACTVRPSRRPRPRSTSRMPTPNR